MTGATKNPICTDGAAARRFLEGVRWPVGLLCVHCGAFGDDIAPVQNTGNAPSRLPRARDDGGPRTEMHRQSAMPLADATVGLHSAHGLRHIGCRKASDVVDHLRSACACT